MKSSLRRLTIIPLLGLATAAMLALGWHALSLTSERNQAAQTTRIEDVLAAPSARRNWGGNEILADAIVSLERRSQVTAQVRQQSFVNDLQVFGQGAYRQQGRGEQRRVKWELQTQVGDERASLVQLVDDHYLWTDQRFSSKRIVERVDLWQLRRQFKNIDDDFRNVAPGQAGAFAGGHSFGGLSMLLESLARNFNFATPRQLQLGSEPVIALRGNWKPHRLRELLELSEKESPTEFVMPSRIPVEVLVLIGSRDYFPYLIEYRNASDPVAIIGDSTNEVDKLSERPLVRIEFYQVNLSEKIDASEFVFMLPSDTAATDVTQRYADRIRRRQAEQVAAKNPKSTPR